MEETSQSKRVLETDVVILGGGPGGSATGIFLAEGGLRVLVLEKSKFPRFRIGESLLPKATGMLRRLGVLDRMDKAGFLRKNGAEFTIADGSEHIHNRFINGMMPDCTYAYEVERAKFDQLLLDRARECGCEVMEETTARSVRDLGESWEVLARTGENEEVEIRSRWLIDATGRETFLAKRFKLEEEPLPYPKRLAIYGHFEGIPLQPEGREGNIVIARLSDGWIWNIPLAKNKTSLGVVASLERFRSEKRSPEEFFESEVRRSKYFSDLTAGAERVGPVRVTTDYCFMYRKFGGSRYLLVGDSAAFIDPVFSSGVYLAMDAASRASELILRAEKRGRSLTKREVAGYTNGLKKSILVMRKLIEVFYDNHGFAVFLRPTDRLRLASAVNSVVAGNTDLPFRVWWRFKLFLLICRLNRKFRFIPSVFPEEAKEPEPAPVRS